MGGLLHQALHDQDQLRPGHAAVGRGGRLVGGDRAAPGPVGGHLVDAGQLGRGHQRLDRAGERERGVGAHVAVDVGGQAEDRAVRAERGADLVALLVAVERGGQVLLPVLHPADRAAQPHRDPGQGGLLPAGHAFQPEPPADVRGDHPDPLLGDAERLGHRGPDLVRDLGRDVHDDLLVPLVPLGQAGPALHGQRGQPAAAHGRGDHHRRGREDAVQPLVVEHGQVDQAVAGRLLMHLGGARGGGGVEAGHHRLGGPVHVNQLDRVLCEVRVLGQHHGHRLADVPDPADGQQRQRGRHEPGPLQHGQQGRVAQVRGGERGRHARQGQGGGRRRSRAGSRPRAGCARTPRAGSRCGPGRR